MRNYIIEKDCLYFIMVQKRNIKKCFQKILLNFFLFFAFLCPYFKLGNISINSAYIFIMFPSFIYLFEKFNKIKIFIKKKTFIPIVILGLTFVCALINQILFSFNDFTLVKLSFVGIFIYLSSLFYLEKFRLIYKDCYREKICENFINTICINSIISLLCIFIEPFRNLFYSFIDINDLVFSYGISTRFSGFIFTGFSFLSTVNSFAIILLLIFIFFDKEKIILGGCKFCIIFIHIIFLGRTGLVTFVVGIFLLFILLRKKMDKNQVKKFYLLLFFLVPFFISFILISVDKKKILDTLTWAFEIFINLFKNGSLSTTSTDELLKNHFILPETVFNLIFGTGYFSRDFVDSDIGYIQILTGSGLFLLLITFSLYFIGIIRYFISIKSIYSFFLLYISFCIFIVNLKDLYYISYTSYTLLYFIIYTIVGDSNENNSHYC